LFSVLALAAGVSGWLACSNSAGPGGTGTGVGSGNGGSGSQTSGTGGSTGSGSGGSTTTGTGTGQGGNGTSAGQGGDTGTGTGNGGSTGGGGTGTTGTGGATTTGTGGATTTGTGGTTTTGTGGATTTGTGGATTTGTGGTGAGGTGVSGPDPCGTPPLRPLKVTAPAGFHTHGGAAAMDNRVTPLGKMVIDLGVSGSTNFSTWVVQRGYHGVASGSFGECNAPNLGAGRDAVGNCRINQEWASVKAHVYQTVSGLATSNPEEDWGYFLTADGKDIRWSDVAFMGVSHGATTAAIIGRVGVCVWRVVSSAGPRDNTCGKGPFTLPYNAASPPFDPNCPPANIASWLDQPSKTPMDRFYVIDGVSDGEYGDIMFNVNYTKYPGAPVQFDATNAVLTGTNRFISMGGGHLDFVNSAENVKPPNTNAVLNIAFAIPPANQH
jgi:hypothetical protein